MLTSMQFLLRHFLVVSILLLMTSTAIRAQTYLLLDRKWHKPAIESDTVTRANLSDGLFPIYRQDIVWTPPKFAQLGLEKNL